MPKNIQQIFTILSSALLFLLLPAHANELKQRTIQELSQKLSSSPNEKLSVIVSFKDANGSANQRSTLSSELLGTLRATNSAELKKYDNLPLMALTVDADGLEVLRDTVSVERVYENKLKRPNLLSSTKQVQANLAWSRGKTGGGTKIAVLDTGMTIRSEMLNKKFDAEACFTSNAMIQGVNIQSRCWPNNTETAFGKNAAEPNCSPCFSGSSHGTEVAAVAVGNGPVLDGVARDSRLIAINVFSGIFDQDFCGVGEYGPTCLVALDSDILAGLDYVLTLANNRNIAAVNLSLGGGLFNGSCDSVSPYTNVFRRLKVANIAVVVAAGNDASTTSVSDPACVTDAIAVGSVSTANAVSLFTNSSVQLDLLAPGEQILTAGENYLNDYNLVNGTSFSAPHVAGAIAILKAANPKLTVDEIEQGLKQSGLPITDPGNGLVRSLIQIDGALDLLQPDVNLAPIYGLLFN